MLFRLRRILPDADLGAVDPVNVECLMMSMLSMVTSELRHSHRVLPCLTALAEKYVGRDYTARDLRLVRDALTFCIRQCLCDAFDATSRAAWARATELLIAKMMGTRLQDGRLLGPRIRHVP